MYISEIRTKAPADERMPLERKFYDTLEKLKIPYEQVDNDPASSMEECAEVDKAIGTEIRKNVFLCNQKKTTFFLLVMPADKDENEKFRTVRPSCLQSFVRTGFRPGMHVFRPLSKQFVRPLPGSGIFVNARMLSVRLAATFRLADNWNENCIKEPI